MSPNLRRSFSIALAVAALLMVSVVPVGATVPGENGQIALVSDRDGNSEIYVMGPDGSNPTRLTNDPAVDSDPDWSPDGRMLAFVSDRAGASAIYVMNSDGTEVRLIGEGTSPSWSPDGARFAFLSGESVWVMNADGSDRRRVTTPSTDTKRRDPSGNEAIPIGDFNPAWSPDGEKILFTRGFEAFWSIAFTVAPTGGPLEVISEFINAHTNDWAPDANLIAGSQFPVGQSSLLFGGTVFAISPAGEAVFTVPSPAGGSNMFEPVWSPDGDVLAVTWSKSRDGTDPTNQMDVHVATAAASGVLVNLTNHPASDTQPDWQSLNPYPIGLVDPSTGIWYLRGESAAVSAFYFGNPGDYPMMGDWDGDGVDTAGLFRQSDGFVYLRNSNTQGVADLRFFLGNPGDIPLAGDFDGDGFDTVAIYRPAEGRVHVINRLGSGDTGLGTADLAYYFGNPGDKPFVGDFDGDGVDTIGLHRESTGLMYFKDTHTPGPADWTFLYGDPGDRVVAFDWRGDGFDSASVFRPSNSKVFIRFSNTSGAADREFFFGRGSWLPVTGEFGLA